MVTFTAPNDYDPETVTLTMNGTTTEPYVISTPPVGLSDLQRLVRVYRSVLDPKDVRDIFGTRIAKRFIVVQVTVTNRSKDYQFLIHDISLDATLLAGGLTFGSAEGPVIVHSEEGSVELHLLRGVAEAGQSGDPRNRALRFLRGAGTVAAGLIGVTDFGSSYAPSVAMWNGPLVSAFTEVWPDMTVNQLNRLNDSAYTSNTIVPKQQAKVMAVFVPQSIFLKKDQRTHFWREPSDFAAEMLRARWYVDGAFIQEVQDLAPTLTTVTVDDSAMKNFQNDKPEVKGSIAGKYLSGTDIKLLNSDLPGVSIRVDGTPTDSQLNFVINSDAPVAPGKVLKFGVSKKGQDTVKETDLAITYSAAAPTLTKVDPPTAMQGDQDKVLTLTGTNFFRGDTQVTVAPNDGVTVGSVDVKDSKSLEVKITVTATAPTTNRQLIVTTKGGSSSTSLAIKGK